MPFNDRKEVHETARRLAALFAEEVAPLLPRSTGDTLEFTVVPGINLAIDTDWSS